MLPSFFTVLAAGEAGSVVMAIVLICSIIGWVMNLIQGNNPKKNQPRNRPRPADDEKSELERFLQEVVGNKPAEPERKKPQQPRKPRPQNEKKGGKPKPQNQRPAVAQRPANTERPGARLAQTHLATMSGGDGVRSHVSSHLEPRNVDAKVQQDVDGAVRRDIADAVQKDIGTDGTLITPIARPVHPLIQALRNPQGVRQAILLSEILDRPRSLR